MEFFLFGFIIGVALAAFRAAWLSDRIEADDSMYNTPDRIGRNSPYSVPAKANQLEEERLTNGNYFWMSINYLQRLNPTHVWH